MAVSNLPGLGSIKPGNAVQDIKNWANIVQSGTPISANTMPATAGQAASTAAKASTTSTPATSTGNSGGNGGGGNNKPVSTGNNNTSTAGNANSAANAAASAGGGNVSTGSSGGGRGSITSISVGNKANAAESPVTGTTTGAGTGSATGTTAEDALLGNLEELRKSYQDEIRKAYDYNAGKIQSERDAQLRDQYLLHQKTMAALPEQLAAMGVTGGGAQSNLTKLLADYQGGRNDIFGSSREQTADAGQQMQQDVAQKNLSLLEMWQEYQQQLERDKRNAQYDYRNAMAGA